MSAAAIHTDGIPLRIHKPSFLGLSSVPQWSVVCSARASVFSLQQRVLAITPLCDMVSDTTNIVPNTFGYYLRRVFF